MNKTEKAIRKIAKKKGFTLLELAKEINKKEPTVHSYLKVGNMTTDKLKALTKPLKYSVVLVPDDEVQKTHYKL